MKKRRFAITILILSAAVVIACVAIYLIVAGGGQRREKTARLDELLAGADYDISLGYYEKALERLERAFDLPLGENGSLRVLERAYQISYNLNDFGRLYPLARTAYLNIPGSPKLAEIYLYASIRAREEASPQTGQLLKRGGGRLAYLHAEAFLRGLVDTVPEADQDAELEAILSLISLPGGAGTGKRTGRPAAAGAFLDPYALQRLGTELEEPRLHLDAAVLWMERGDVESAYALVTRQAGQPLFEEAGIFITYDAGREQEALSALQQHRRRQGGVERADLLLMEADLNLVLGNQGEARRLYGRIIDSRPDFAWTPYLNLAIMAEREGERQAAQLYREKAYRLFPDTGPVVTAYARNLSVFGDRGERARDVLSGYLERHEEDYQAQLLLLELQDTAASPALHQASLWSLYNRHPDSRMLCEQLFLYLLEFNDLSGAQAVLRSFQAATGRTEEPWLLGYRAVLAAAGRDYAEAIRLLRERIAREESWEARVNLAVLLGEARQPMQAIEQLIEAENLLPEQDRRNNQSRIRSRIAEQYLILGDPAAARRECEYAIDLDAGNFHAHRLLRILEGQ
jgi:tetratricopeptide (TPR) repeat protein